MTVTEEEFDRIYAVNVKSIYLFDACGRARDGEARWRLDHQHGLHGRRAPASGLTWYNGTKGAVITLTPLAWRRSSRRRTSASTPSIRSAARRGLLQDFMGVEDTPENRARFIAGIPLGRMSKPEDIANAALFLADPASSFITGVAIEVDGGRCI